MKILAYLFVFVICLTFVACEKSSQDVTAFTGNVMTIEYRILIGKSLSTVQQNHVERTISRVFHEVNHIYNKWNPHSELSQLNDFPAGVPFELSPKLEKLLLLTARIVEITEGRFDPTIESVQQLWKQKNVPTNDSLENLAVGWSYLQFSPGKVAKLKDLRLDLGGIAKGYAVDLMLQALNKEGFNDIYVEWGGEIAVSGQHPAGRPWMVYISHFDDPTPENAIAVVALNNQAVATSGDYLQQWKMENDLYFHIIDPKTKHPLKATATSIASASVCANTCAFADGLATAAMIFSSVDEANVWLGKIQESYPEIRFWIISRG